MGFYIETMILIQFFNTGDKYVECGARPKHLRNKDVILGEMQKDGELVFHWDRIFPSLSK